MMSRDDTSEIQMVQDHGDDGRSHLLSTLGGSMSSRSDMDPNEPCPQPPVYCTGCSIYRWAMAPMAFLVVPPPPPTRATPRILHAGPWCLPLGSGEECSCARENKTERLYPFPNSAAEKLNREASVAAGAPGGANVVRLRDPNARRLMGGADTFSHPPFSPHHILSSVSPHPPHSNPSPASKRHCIPTARQHAA